MTPHEQQHLFWRRSRFFWAGTVPYLVSPQLISVEQPGSILTFVLQLFQKLQRLLIGRCSLYQESVARVQSTSSTHVFYCSPVKTPRPSAPSPVQGMVHTHLTPSNCMYALSSVRGVNLFYCRSHVSLRSKSCCIASSARGRWWQRREEQVDKTKQLCS